MKKEKPEWIFECRKCSHHVYCGKERIGKILEKECPECGEEQYRLWILIGEGDFKDVEKQWLKK